MNGLSRSVPDGPASTMRHPGKPTGLPTKDAEPLSWPTHLRENETPWGGLNARPELVEASSPRSRTPQACHWHHLAAPGWFATRHQITRPRQVATEAVPNSSTGSAGRRANDNRLSLAPAERRPRNLSVPPDRLFKTMARPPKGDRITPGTRGGIETPCRALALG